LSYDISENEWNQNVCILQDKLLICCWKRLVLRSFWQWLKIKLAKDKQKKAVVASKLRVKIVELDKYRK